MDSVIRKELEEQGFCLTTTDGDSMMPFLAHHRDIILIRRKAPSERLKKYDIPLYMRDGGKNYILHRIIKVRSNDYVICGDNRWRKEYGITDRHILGVLVSVRRAGRELRLDSFACRAYARIWYAIYPLRALYMIGREAAGRMRRYLKKRKRKP